MRSTTISPQDERRTVKHQGLTHLVVIKFWLVVEKTCSLVEQRRMKGTGQPV
jgi:hypothetical protein